MPVLSGAAIVDFGSVVVVVAAAVVVGASVVDVAASSRPSPPKLTAPATTTVPTSAIAATAGRTPTRCPPAVAALTDPNLGVRRPRRDGDPPLEPSGGCGRARIVTDGIGSGAEPRGVADLSARRREDMWTTLKGKGAVITGGASGIGLATARGARRSRGPARARRRRSSRRSTAPSRSCAPTGSRPTAWCATCGRWTQVTALADAAFDALGAVHVVFNNAGIAVGGPVLEMTHDDWRWMIDVDLWGPIHGVEAFLPRLVEQGEGGHVLFTASFAGLVPEPRARARTASPSTASWPWPRCCGGSCGSTASASRCCARCGSGRRSATPSATAAPTTAGRPAAALVPDQDAGNDDLAGRVLDVDGVAALTVDAIVANRLYVLPHEESRASIRRRFERIDRTFDEQAAAGAGGSSEPMSL